MVADRLGNVHLLYGSGGAGGNQLEYRRWSPERGWGEMVVLFADSGGGVLPFLAVDADGLVHVVLQDRTAVSYFRQISNGTWTEPVIVGEQTQLGDPSVLVVGQAGVIHFIMHDRAAQEILYLPIPPVE